jgi:nicotinate-nucleotide--dimethylbenzimidazole phosphoribosyltransferase
MTDTAEPEVNFAEIRALVPQLPGPHIEAATAATERARAAGATGRNVEIRAWLAAWQGKPVPLLDHPRICLFAGNHGVVAGTDRSAAARVQSILDGDAEINRLCEAADADLRVYEMALDRPTRDFSREAAMSEEECARAMAYGMMAVEPGLDLLCLGALGDGSETAAAALCLMLHDGVASDWSAPDVAKVVAAGAMRHGEAANDPLEALRRIGGYELAAVAGAVMAARLARVPVVLDGFAALAAAGVVWKLDRRGLDHCRVAAIAAGQGAQSLLARLKQSAMLGSEKDPGVGAARAVPLLREALGL